MNPPLKESVVTANGYVISIIGDGPIAFIPSLTLHNTFLIPTLFNHLLSVGQITEQLNCILPMFPFFITSRYPDAGYNWVWY